MRASSACPHSNRSVQTDAGADRLRREAAKFEAMAARWEGDYMDLAG